jgi:hypothetical protein
MSVSRLVLSVEYKPARWLSREIVRFRKKVREEERYTMVTAKVRITSERGEDN